MSYVMVCRGDAMGFAPELDGLYLSHFDPDYRDGSGDVRWTPELALARRFESVVEVIVTWRTASTSVPLRLDGLPNRPLTAWSIEPMRAEDAPELAPPV